MTTMHDLLPLLSPLALAILETKITESLDDGLADGPYISLLALAAMIRQRGYALWGEDYIYLVGAAELGDGEENERITKTIQDQDRQSAALPA